LIHSFKIYSLIHWVFIMKKRIPPTTIYIVCEGKNTEPNYFERIKEAVEDDNLYAITIYPDKTDDRHKTDPIGLINEAQKNIHIYDEVWAVFDKDGYTKHKEAFEKANQAINGKTVNIAFSSIAFEHWVLLHFEKCDKVFRKSAEIIEQKLIDNETYLPDYTKSANVDIYPKLKSFTPIAIENAAWLRCMMRDEINDNPLHEINPYTDVDVLVKRLFNVDENIEFQRVSEHFSIGSIDFVVQTRKGNFTLQITNKKDVGIVTNEIELYFQEGIRHNIPNEIIEPNSTKIISVEMPLVLKYKNTKARVIP